MIEMPINNEDEPMGDNFDYGYFPDNKDYGEIVMNEGVNGGYA
jgi:hypothetical protein